MSIRRGGAGHFAENPERAAEVGQRGGRVSGGNFKNNPERAKEAGRKGSREKRRPNQPERAFWKIGILNRDDESPHYGLFNGLRKRGVMFDVMDILKRHELNVRFSLIADLRHLASARFVPGTDIASLFLH